MPFTYFHRNDFVFHKHSRFVYVEWGYANGWGGGARRWWICAETNNLQPCEHFLVLLRFSPENSKFFSPSKYIYFHIYIIVGHFHLRSVFFSLHSHFSPQFNTNIYLEWMCVHVYFMAVHRTHSLESSHFMLYLHFNCVCLHGRILFCSITLCFWVSFRPLSCHLT